MFICYSIHAHQKHVTFVFPSYFMSIHPFFIHFPHFHILILVTWVICELRSLFLIDEATHSIWRWNVIWIEMTKVASTVNLP